MSRAGNKPTAVSINPQTVREMRGLVPGFNLSKFVRQALDNELLRQHRLRDKMDAQLDTCKRSNRWP